MKQPNVWIGRTLAGVIAAAAVLYFLNPYHVASRDPFGRLLGFLLFRNSSPGMSPTVPQGKFFIVNVATLRNRDPHIGEIIAFRYPLDPSVSYLKRVVAIGGTVVERHEGVLYIDGRRAEEKYLPANITAQGGSDFPPFSVPPHNFFVMGDNRANSADSRMWGPVPRDLVIGTYVPSWGD